jgi:RNA recognition motif-containing protein
MQIYVGNLPLEFADADLRSMFEAFGTVRAATIGRSKKTGISEGYGFVEMPSKSEARAAIEALRGKEIQGKPIRAKLLKPDDEFQRHAQNLHQAAKLGGPGLKGGKRFLGDGSYRGSGAIRRGGKRGS